jgi:hypothetical protein
MFVKFKLRLNWLACLGSIISHEIRLLLQFGARSRILTCDSDVSSGTVVYCWSSVVLKGDAKK